jgi:hypothetical protein
MFNARDVAESYRALTMAQGAITFRNWIDRALDQPGYAVECPLAPQEAIDKLAKLYPFNSVVACRRYLQPIRKHALETSSTDADQAFIADCLSTLLASPARRQG